MKRKVIEPTPKILKYVWMTFITLWGEDGGDGGTAPVRHFQRGWVCQRVRTPQSFLHHIQMGVSPPATPFKGLSSLHFKRSTSPHLKASSLLNSKGSTSPHSNGSTSPHSKGSSSPRSKGSTSRYSKGSYSPHSKALTLLYSRWSTLFFSRKSTSLNSKGSTLPHSKRSTLLIPKGVVNFHHIIVHMTIFKFRSFLETTMTCTEC